MEKADQPEYAVFISRVWESSSIRTKLFFCTEKRINKLTSDIEWPPNGPRYNSKNPHSDSLEFLTTPELKRQVFKILIH